MNPGKESIGLARADPFDRFAGRYVAAPLNRVEKARIVFGDVESIGERVEAALEPEGRARTIELTNAAVEKPDPFSVSAISGTSPPSAGATLSRMPCSAG
jgi:hypothetical protein